MAVEPEFKYIYLIGKEEIETKIGFNSGDGRGHDSFDLMLSTKHGIYTNRIIIADIQAFEALISALSKAKDEYYNAWAELPECCQKQYGREIT